MQLKNQTERAAMTLEDHLMTRELVDFDILTLNFMNGAEPKGRAEITFNEETLKQVATLWETFKPALTAVIAARIKPLIMQVALRDIPQEVTVTRQAILELVQLLNDFELLSREAVVRSQTKAEENIPTQGT